MHYILPFYCRITGYAACINVIIKMNDTEGKVNNLLLLIFHHVFSHTCSEIWRRHFWLLSYPSCFFPTTILKRDFIGVPILIFRKVCKDICVCVQKLQNLNLRSKQSYDLMNQFDLANWRNSFVYGRYSGWCCPFLLFCLWQHLELMRCFIKTNGKSHSYRLTLSFK